MRAPVLPVEDPGAVVADSLEHPVVVHRAAEFLADGLGPGGKERVLGNGFPSGQHLGVHVSVEVRGLAEVLGEDAARVHHPRHVRGVGPILDGVLLPAAVAVEDHHEVLGLQAPVRDHRGALRGAGQQPARSAAEAEGRGAGGAEKATAIHAHRCRRSVSASAFPASGEKTTSRPRTSSSRTGLRLR